MELSPSQLHQEIKADLFSSTSPSKLTVVRMILRAALSDLTAKFEGQFLKSVTPEFCQEVIKSFEFIHQQMDESAFNCYLKLVLLGIFKKCEDKLLLVQAIIKKAETTDERQSQLYNSNVFNQEIVSAFMMPDLTKSNVQLVILLSLVSGLPMHKIVGLFIEKLGVKSLKSNHKELEAFFGQMKELEPELFTVDEAISVMNNTCRLYVWTALAKIFSPEISKFSTEEIQSKIKIELRMTEKPFTNRIKLDETGNQRVSIRLDPKTFEKKLGFLDIVLFKFFFPHKLMKEAENFILDFQESSMPNSEEKEKSLELRYFTYRIAVYGVNSTLLKEVKDRNSRGATPTLIELLYAAAKHYGIEISDDQFSSKTKRLSSNEEIAATHKAIICLEESRDCLKKIDSLKRSPSNTDRLSKLEQILKELKEIDTLAQSSTTQRRRKELQFQY